MFPQQKPIQNPFPISKRPLSGSMWSQTSAASWLQFLENWRRMVSFIAFFPWWPKKNKSGCGNIGLCPKNHPMVFERKLFLVKLWDRNFSAMKIAGAKYKNHPTKTLPKTNMTMENPHVHSKNTSSNSGFSIGMLVLGGRNSFCCFFRIHEVDLGRLLTAGPQKETFFSGCELFNFYRG